MAKFRYLIGIVFFLSALVVSVAATEKPIGSWNSFLPYNSAYGVCTDGNNIYIVTKYAFFTYDNPVDGNMQAYSKVSGMSDVGMQCIAYDMSSSSTILVYSNGNIDIFKDNTFYNIPDLKLKMVTGLKAVYSVYVENGTAYLSTSLGVIVIDIAHRVITETYQFLVANQVVAINAFVGFGSNFYAITAAGLYSVPKSVPDLQNFQEWTHVDSTDAYSFMAVAGGNLYLASQSAVYQYSTVTGATNIYTSSQTVSHLDPSNHGLFVSEQNTSSYSGYVKQFDSTNRIIDSIKFTGLTAQVVQLMDGQRYVADAGNGIAYWHNGALFYYAPGGPGDVNSFDIYANNGSVWVAHGGFNDLFLPNNNGDGLSHFDGNNWRHFQEWSYTPFWDTLGDFVAVTKDESSGTLYAASFGNYGNGGVFALNSDGTYKIYKQGIFDRGSSSGGWEMAGLAVDNSGNLWVTSYTSLHELCVLEKSTGNWYKYHVNISRSPPYDGGPITLDNYGQVWYVCSYGNGIIGYNPNGTLSDPSDDSYYRLSTGVGFGNLPSNNTYCIVNDLSGNLWVGTDNGIGIIYQPSNCISEKCDATIPIVQYDQFANYLFIGENVRTIAVDGANRKWVGTDNGVWLLAADASSIVNRFTQDNSPLPSNHVKKISIDKVTGDVYIGTDQGLVSYRSTATQGGDTNSGVTIFPNPVHAGYTGTIAIKGLVANADVRITDIDGELVYHTTAFGGQATWNGLDYKGHRPQSGVYLVFVTSTGNSQSSNQSYVGKIVFLQ